MTQSSRFSLFSLTNFVLLLSAGILWGSQYFFTKLALVSFSTTTIAAGRVSIGIVFLAFLRMIKSLMKRKSSGATLSFPLFARHFPDFLLIGLLEATVPCILIAWAQHYLASSVTAVLIGTVPLFTTLLEALFIQECRLSARKVIGISFGFIGIIVLVKAEFFSSLQAMTQGPSVALPIIAVLISALSFASSMLLIKVRLGSRLEPMSSTQGILLGALVTIIPAALFITKPWTLTSFHYQFSSIISIIALGIFCSGLAYTLFVILINRAGPCFASMTNYLVPPTGAFIGVAFSGEELTIALIASLAIILFSLWLANDSNTIC